jgi:FixJ family two-component response regulator
MAHRPLSNPGVLVHVVDVDDDVQRLLSRWLTAAGIESRTYAHLGAFLSTDRADVPGCLLIDAQPSAIRGLESQALLLPLAIRCPIVVMACEVDVIGTVRVMKSGAIELVEKPLREREIVMAVYAAIEFDRQQRRVARHHAELRARFAMLSPRERQVMERVTTGMLNKQIGADLDLSEVTVKAHRRVAMRKMGARTLADLVRMADALGEDLAPLPGNGRLLPARSAAIADRHSRA